MRKFNKEPNKLYFGLPEGSLRPQILRIMEKVGWPVASDERVYEFPSYKDDSLIFRVFKSKEMPEAVAQGVVDVSIIGEDILLEAQREKDVDIVGTLPFSRKTTDPARLVLAARAGSFDSPEVLRGQRIATELPILTRMKLKEICGYSDANMPSIFPSLGKTEAKITYGMADAIADITETGATLRANGFVELATLFKSYPRLVANPEATSEFRERIEDILFLMSSVLDAERKPSYVLRFNIPNEKIDSALEILPNPEAANILPTNSNLVSIVSQIEADKKRDLVTQLNRMGATKINADQVDETYKPINPPQYE